MRRLAALFVVVAVGAALLAAVTRGAEGDGEQPSGTYLVRAIFDNASAAVQGEDVKVAGAKIGTVDGLDVTPERKAVIVLKIDDKRFAPFHADATCRLRPEGVLAVKFVECDPGTARSPVLTRVRRGDGKGQYLLPVQRTSSSVDLDLVNDIYRQPTGQELAILLDEFGTGLAGRGSDLNAVIHRANPALGQTDRFLRVLASQSDRLERFAHDAEVLLHPLARDRKSIADFIVAANRTNRASALHAGDVQRSIERLPLFLRALRSQMQELHRFSDQGIPLLADLQRAGPGLGRMTANLTRFATAAKPAARDVGATVQRITPKLLSTLTLLRKLQSFGRVARPVSTELAALLRSFDMQQGIKHFLDITYFAANAVNGFDAVGHYARAEALSGACAEYTAAGFFGCDAQWGPTATSAKSVDEGPGGTLSPITAAQAKASEIPPADSPDSGKPDTGTAAPTAVARALSGDRDLQGPRHLLDYLLGP